MCSGARPKISQRQRLFTNYPTYDLEDLSNSLQLSTIEEGLKGFIRKSGEKPPREVGKRVKVRTYKPKKSILSSKFCRF